MIECFVVTPERVQVETTAEFVAVPLYDGELGIGRGHAPTIGRLGAGELRIRQPGGTQTDRYFIRGGFVQVADNTVTVLTSGATPARDLDLDALRAELSTARDEVAAGDEAIAERAARVNALRSQVRVAESAS